MINGRTGREIGTGAISGDPLGFRIETNLDAMAQRPGVAGAPITIHVRDPTGAEFTSLVNGGVTTSLVNIPVNASVYETGPIWATDTSQYRAGSYEVWADCNANGMKDNYNQVGKTTTRTQTGTSVQVGGTSGPSITGVATPTVTATGTAAATVTAVTTTVNATSVIHARPDGDRNGGGERDGHRGDHGSYHHPEPGLRRDDPRARGHCRPRSRSIPAAVESLPLFRERFFRVRPLRLRMNVGTMTIKSRRSVRKYKPSTIPPYVIQDVLDCGRLAPTAENLQPWLFGAVTDKELLRRIAESRTTPRSSPTPLSASLSSAGQTRPTTSRTAPRPR